MAWRDIPISIRHSDDSDGKPIGVADSGDLASVIAVVNSWGAYPEGTAFGQFDLANGCFEVVVSDDD